MLRVQLARLRGVLFAFFVLFAASFSVATGCDRPPDLGGRIAAARDRDAAVGDDERDEGPSFDFALPPPGVPDRGRSLGLVVIQIGIASRCTAALIASNVIVAPARCVASPSCAPMSAADVAVRSSDEGGADLGAVRAIVLPDEGACDGASLAAVVLTQHADGLPPFVPRARPAARGERGRFVAVREDGVRIDRDHVPVVASARSSVALEGGGCGLVPGGALVDESTGELLAVGAFGEAWGGAGPCDDETIALLGVDRARSTVEAALAEARRPLSLDDGGVADAGAPRRGKAARPTNDLGEACTVGADCAAGVCVSEPGASPYCSRTCGPGDRCPSGLRCVAARVGSGACVRSG